MSLWVFLEGIWIRLLVWRVVNKTLKFRLTKDNNIRNVRQNLSVLFTTRQTSKRSSILKEHRTLLLVCTYYMQRTYTSNHAFSVFSGYLQGEEQWKILKPSARGRYKFLYLITCSRHYNILAKTRSRMTTAISRFPAKMTPVHGWAILRI